MWDKSLVTKVGEEISPLVMKTKGSEGSGSEAIVDFCNFEVRGIDVGKVERCDAGVCEGYGHSASDACSSFSIHS
jgi:hypothetical protein